MLGGHCGDFRPTPKDRLKVMGSNLTAAVYEKWFQMQVYSFAKEGACWNYAIFGVFPL